MLQECFAEFEVLQEYDRGTGRNDRITLGTVKLNLAEYVEQSEMVVVPGEDPGVTRRYLMQDSKINSTLKLGIYMKQTEGDKNFIAPALKTAQVFSGIAGIMAGEQAELEDHGGKTSPCQTRVCANITSRALTEQQIPRSRRAPGHVPTYPRRILVRATRRAQGRRMHRGHLRRGGRLGRP
jgi:hypothetical protein